MPHINRNPNWTPERLQYLRDNYRTMLAADIAKHFDGLFTRNAVIGRARRLGLQSDHRMRPARRGPRRILTTTKPKVSPRGKQEAKVEEVKLKILRGPVTFMQLENWHCREIVKDKPIMYCGHHKADGSSYCLEHHNKNHVRLSNSRVEKYYGL